MIKIKFEGEQGSGKTILMEKVTQFLKWCGYNFIIKEDEHVIEIIKGE